MLWQDFLIPYLGIIVGSIFALFVLGHMLRQRRPPASTVAWLLAIILIPYVGIPLYILLGGRKIRRLARRKKKLLLGGFEEIPLEKTALADRFLRSYGLPGATANNHIEFHNNGQTSYQALIDLIDRAEVSIHIAIFIFAADPIGQDLLERLEKKAKQGIDVRLLLDSFGCRLLPSRRLRPLRSAGGRVAYFMPMFWKSLRSHLKFPGNAHLRNHRKLVVVDATEVWAGGANLAQEYIGPRRSAKRWKDLTFIIRGEAAKVYQEIFRLDWNFASSEQMDKTLPAHCLVTGGTETIQVVPSGPDIPDDPFYSAVLMACHTANHRLWVVTPYFIPDEPLLQAMSIAIHRGVDVRVVVPLKSNHLVADIARGSFLRDLQQAGGTVLLHRGKMMHAKALIFDQNLAVVGSANMDARSLFFNYEVVSFLYSPQAIAAVDSYIISLLRHCRVGVRQAGRFREFGAGLIRLIAPLL